MARGRAFSWQSADGNQVLLSDRLNGYWVLSGVQGLGKPAYSRDEDQSPTTDGTNLRGVRSSGRKIFLPMDVNAPTRADFLRFSQWLAQILDPELGMGTLFITDGGSTYRIRAIYDSGLEGDDSSAGENGSEVWSRVGLVLSADPFFEYAAPNFFSFGYSAAVPFFPILPLRLSPNQVLSDVSQPSVTNLITNPSFEVSLAGWSGNFSGSSVDVAATQSTVPTPESGSFCARLDFPSAVSGDSGAFFIQPTGLLTAGARYTIKARVWVPPGAPPVRISSADASSTYNVTFGAWEWLTVSFNAISLSKFFSITQNPALNQNGGTAYLDKVMLTAGNETTYIDGTQPNCHWTGTAQLSTSYRDPVSEPTLINNPGSKYSWPIFKINGPATRIDLYNRDKSQHVSLSYPLDAGRVITIDTQAKTIKLDDGSNLYGYADSDDFWSLDPGDNFVTLTALGAGVATYINGYFYPRVEALAL